MSYCGFYDPYIVTVRPARIIHSLYMLSIETPTWDHISLFTFSP